MAYRVPMKSALKSSVSKMFTNMIENGIHKTFLVWTDRYVAAVFNPIMETDDGQAHTLKMDQLSGVFYLYVIGMTSAIAAFVLEWWWSERRGSSNRT